MNKIQTLETENILLKKEIENLNQDLFRCRNKLMELHAKIGRVI
jgi:primosomal protein N''